MIAPKFSHTHLTSCINCFICRILIYQQPVLYRKPAFIFLEKIYVWKISRTTNPSLPIQWMMEIVNDNSVIKRMLFATTYKICKIDTAAIP